jgi:hypothetical protein
VFVVSLFVVEGVGVGVRQIIDTIDQYIGTYESVVDRDERDQYDGPIEIPRLTESCQGRDQTIGRRPCRHHAYQKRTECIHPEARASDLQYLSQSHDMIVVQRTKV